MMMMIWWKSLGWSEAFWLFRLKSNFTNFEEDFEVRTWLLGLLRWKTLLPLEILLEFRSFLEKVGSTFFERGWYGFYTKKNDLTLDWAFKKINQNRLEIHKKLIYWLKMSDFWIEIWWYIIQINHETFPLITFLQNIAQCSHDRLQLVVGWVTLVIKTNSK